MSSSEDEDEEEVNVVSVEGDHNDRKKSKSKVRVQCVLVSFPGLPSPLPFRRPKDEAMYDIKSRLANLLLVICMYIIHWLGPTHQVYVTKVPPNFSAV